jgi:hypothetical protein
MNNPKTILITLIATAAAAFGGVMGLIGITRTPVGAVSISITLVAIVVIMYVAYDEWLAIEEAEKQEEIERQRERDKVQLEILRTLRQLNRQLTAEQRLDIPEDEDDDSSSSGGSKSQTKR